MQFGKNGANEGMVGQRPKAGHTMVQDLNFYVNTSYTNPRLCSRAWKQRVVHLQTLEWQGIPYKPWNESQLYHPDVIREFSDSFKPARTLAMNYLTKWFDAVHPVTRLAFIRHHGERRP